MPPNPAPGSLPPAVRFLILFFASGFFLSYAPARLIGFFQRKFRGQTLAERRWTGAGLVGSVLGALTYFFLPPFIAMSFLAVGGGIGLSILASHYAEKILETHDDSRIIIDEWIGAWIALLGFPREEWMLLLIPFVLFRLFDVLKGPWGRAIQRLPGGWGVTLDDVAAGLLANLAARLLIAVLPIPFFN